MNLDTPFRLENCIIRPKEYLLELPDGEVKVLQPKFIEVLAYLAHQYPQIVEREELINTIWDGNFYVGEKSLNNAVWNLRNELKSTETSYIETVRKKGYRLQVKPEFLANELALLATNEKDTSNTKKHQKLTITLVAFFAVFFTTFLLYKLVFKNENNSVVEIISVVSEPGREVYPSISPDNNYLVYSWRRIGQRPNLFIKDMVNNKVPARQLTFSEFYEGRVVWHANGEDIYYQRKHWNYDRCEVVNLNIVTMAKKVIASCTGEVDFSLSISPDGNQLAYVVNEKAKKPTVQILNLESNVKTSVLYQCQVDCRYEDLDVEFSPDGKQLVISRTLDDGFNEDVFIYSIANGELEQLTDSEGDIKGLAWHPKGDRIVYSAIVSGSRDGYVISLKDKTTTKLNIPGFSYPRFVPESQEVLFHSWQVLSSLSSLSLDDNLATTPFPVMHSEYSYNSPHYSAQTDRLVFISNESGFEEIWTSKVDGTDRKQLTTLASHLTFPRWSHDGENIAFLGPKTKDKKNALYVLNMKTHVVRKIPSDFAQHFRPSWLIDDSGLIAAAKTNNKVSLYAFPINFKAPYILLDAKVRYAEQGNDGQVWFSPGRNGGLWRFNPNSEDISPQLVLDKDKFRVRHKWEVTEAGLYFQHDYANSHQFHFYNFENKEITPIVKLPMGTIQRLASMTYVPNQNKIVFTQLDFPKVDIKRLRHPLLE